MPRDVRKELSLSILSSSELDTVRAGSCLGLLGMDHVLEAPGSQFDCSCLKIDVVGSVYAELCQQLGSSFNSFRS